MAPSTTWSESIPRDESARHERLGEQLHALQEKAAGGGARARALHAKGQAGVEAELTIASDVPEPARVGIFANGGTYRAYVRFSNGGPRRLPDRKPDVRGIAIKVLGVGGKKIIPGMQDATTQDFLLIRSASTPFRNAEEFVGFLLAAQSPLLALPKVVGLFGLGRGLRILQTMLKGVSAPAGSLATVRYFSALPIQWGPYAVHYALAPREPAAADARTPDDLSAELGERLRKGPVVYDLRVQFYVDPVKTPIEDGSVEWLERDAPFVTVATLTLLRQDIASPRGRAIAERVEGLSFDPWHAPIEFRPLGDMMRARNAAYRISTKARGAAGEPAADERIG